MNPTSISEHPGAFHQPPGTSHFALAKSQLGKCLLLKPGEDGHSSWARVKLPLAEQDAQCNDLAVSLE